MLYALCLGIQHLPPCVVLGLERQAQAWMRAAISCCYFSSACDALSAPVPS